MKTNDNNPSIDDEINWTIGEHEIKVKYLGFETIFKINIINNQNSFKITYYINNEIVKEDFKLQNSTINDLYDYNSCEKDTIWFIDKELRKKQYYHLE